MVKAVEAHADVPWVVLYVKRWLTAPMALPDGTLATAGSGYPQGSAVSPVLANLFMHYAFDAWMAREYPGIRFERYADDVVVHCVTERQARNLVAAIGDRMEQVGLRLHPDKTKIVYCQGREAATRPTGSPRLRSWGSLFVPVPRARRAERCSPRSSQLSATTPKRRSASRSADGGCTTPDISQPGVNGNSGDLAFAPGLEDVWKADARILHVDGDLVRPGGADPPPRESLPGQVRSTRSQRLRARRRSWVSFTCQAKVRGNVASPVPLPSYVVPGDPFPLHRHEFETMLRSSLRTAGWTRSTGWGGRTATDLVSGRAGHLLRAS